VTVVQTAPILIVDSGRILFIGPVDDVAMHKAMVPVFGAGIDREFELSFEHEKRSCRAEIVAANVRRAVRAFGSRLAVMPIDPVLIASDIQSTDDAISALRKLALGYETGSWDALAKACGLAETRSEYPHHLLYATELIVASVDENVPAADIATSVGLSISRLEHLFQRYIGTTMRSYRLWRRLRVVVTVLQEGGSITDAAVCAGFFDAAHFSNAFKRTFGVTPSSIFSPDLRIHLVAHDDLNL
jgi:AraC-like DNA-binding protein